ncbi:MAG TPA: M20/M25/M40 family metallo-hydrolase [bacterium]|nr:M20/M25/M40 family metallo-hydrolase [bacterium]
MDADLTAAIRRAGEELAADVAARLQAGVRIDSVNPAHGGAHGEGAFQTMFAGELERLGCRVETWEPDAQALADQYPFMRPVLPAQGFGGRPNVVAWAPSAERTEGRSAHLILNSHADTVDAGDPAAWPSPPFSAALTGGRLVGLGAADAKGALFTFLGALAILREAGLLPRKPVALQSVVDEEAGGAGTLDCVRRGYTAGAAVVGEPTGLVVCPGSRGSMTLVMRIAGRRAHPGEGWRGVNAIRQAWRYVDALEALRAELDRTAMHPLWRALPAGHVWNLLALNSGPAGRAVPDVCEVHYNAGMIGGERIPDMRRTIEAAIARVTAADPWTLEHPPQLRWLDRPMDPAVTDPGHPAVTAFAAAGRALGEAVAVRGFSAITDARYLVNIGGIATINFGPGEIHRCHSPEEMLPVDDLRRAMTWGALFIAGYCGAERRAWGR